MSNSEPGVPGMSPKSTPPTTRPEPGLGECAVCQDTGLEWVGGLSRFCLCDQGQTRQRAAWLRECGVPQARRAETLAVFQALPGTEKALAATREFLTGRLTWLLVYGPSGNGKSHLANSIILACLEAGTRARFANTLLLLSELRGLSDQGRAIALLDLGRIPVLALDELVWGTDLEARWVEEVIARRYLGKMPLVVTTNRDIKDIPAPIASRFYELGRVVLNRGKDYRRTDRSS